MKVKDKMTDNDKVPELTNGGFDEFVKDGIVLVDFYAEWCMPCLMMAPVIDEMSEKFRGKIKVGKVNIDDSKELAEDLAVMSVPTLIIFKDGKEVDRMVGSLPADVLEGRINKFV